MMKKANRKSLNSKGQSAVEAVLLLAVFVGLAVLLSREIKESEMIANMVSGPWKSLDGMIQNGVWGPTDEGEGNHPNHIDRHVSTKNDNE